MRPLPLYFGSFMLPFEQRDVADISHNEAIFILGYITGMMLRIGKEHKKEPGGRCLGCYTSSPCAWWKMYEEFCEITASPEIRKAASHRGAFHDLIQADQHGGD